VPGERREDAGVADVTLLALDVDALPAPELPALLAKLDGRAAVIHTSPSDGGSGALLRKLRIYALPSRPMAPAECRHARLAFAAGLGVQCDRSALNPSRILFVGRPTGTPARELWAFEGEAFDVDALLASAPLETASQAPTRATSNELPSSAIELARGTVLGRALIARGAVRGVRELERGPAVVITCPNASAHDRHGARTTDESALYLPPTRGGAGTVSCVRSACAGITDWLPWFEDHELTEAGLILARVTDVHLGNVDLSGRPRLCAVLEGTPPSARYLRCSKDTPAWRALLAAAHTDDPKRIAGAWLGVTLDESGRVDRVYTVAEPQSQRGAA
jgi:hypothetical protein